MTVAVEDGRHPVTGPGPGAGAGGPERPPTREELIAARRRARARELLGPAGGCVDLTDPAPVRVVGVPNPERIDGGRICLGPTTPGFDPAAYAAEIFASVPAPRPGPSIPPGRMIVALAARLVTTAPLTFDASAPTPLGPLRLRARARIYVNWGDGHTAGPYDEPGRPYPDGTIVHRWATAGRYDVTVTYRWTATWQWAGRTEPVPGTLDTTDRIPGYPVIELQATTG
ncbi:MAG: hypothetical protein HYX34_12160 [Actinobacteria bacterium]|nr:hypothetical protein [Actinomycetota bacterium]